MPNAINPEKLHLSKWTAVTSLNREKHFLVTELIRDEMQRVRGCLLQAVLTHRVQTIDWRDLKDDTRWLAGWRT